MIKKVKVRVSDSVLEEDDHTVAFVYIAVEHGIVVKVSTAHRGIYDIADYIPEGTSVDELKEWLRYDPTGSHPEVYHEIFDSLTKTYSGYTSPEDVDHIIDHAPESNSSRWHK